MPKNKRQKTEVADFADMALSIVQRAENRDALEKEGSLLSKIDRQTTCHFEWFSPGGLVNKGSPSIAMYTLMWEGKKYELRLRNVRFHLNKEDDLDRLLFCSNYIAQLDPA